MEGIWDPEAIVAAALVEAKKQIEEAKSKKVEVVQKSKLEGDHGVFQASRDELLLEEPNFLPGAEIKDVDVTVKESGVSADVQHDSASNMTIQIHTICFEPASKDEPDAPGKIPIVMLHGLGGSSVEFHKNYRKLSTERTVYGIDMPGFGLSSRDTHYGDEGDSTYSANQIQKCEDKLVKILESWREKEKIKEMIIVGHSFGGYVAMVYATKHRNRVKQLVLIEPWGIMDEDESEEVRKENPNYLHDPFYIRLAMALSKPFELKPLTLLRTVGYAFGALVFGVLTPSTHKDAYGSEENMYFIGLNTLSDPSGSGEDLFRLLSGGTYVYPVVSFQSRLNKISSYPPMSIIYGENHKIDGKYISFKEEGEILKAKMSKVGHEVEIKEAPTSTHHAHAENPKWFHQYMNELLEKIDKQLEK